MSKTPKKKTKKKSFLACNSVQIFQLDFFFMGFVLAQRNPLTQVVHAVRQGHWMSKSSFWGPVSVNLVTCKADTKYSAALHFRPSLWEILTKKHTQLSRVWPIRGKTLHFQGKAWWTLVWPSSPAEKKSSSDYKCEIENQKTQVHTAQNPTDAFTENHRAFTYPEHRSSIKGWSSQQ